MLSGRTFRSGLLADSKKADWVRTCVEKDGSKSGFESDLVVEEVL